MQAAARKENPDSRIDCGSFASADQSVGVGSFEKRLFVRPREAWMREARTWDPLHPGINAPSGKQVRC